MFEIIFKYFASKEDDYYTQKIVSVVSIPNVGDHVSIGNDIDFSPLFKVHLIEHNIVEVNNGNRVKIFVHLHEL